MTNRISSLSLLTVYLRLSVKVLALGLGLTGNIFKVFSTAILLLRKIRRNPESDIHSNISRVDGRWFWNLNLPGFPSAAFDRVMRHLLAEALGLPSGSGLCTGFVAITRKCGLNCEHCFEWEALNRSESLSDADIIQLIERLIELGVGQIVLTGGEPLNRFETVIQVLDIFRESGVDFWINTSGMGLSEERITRLKRNGLTGIIFSLDHHEESEHDRFRGRKGCYRKVVSSIETANERGLATAVSLCATNSYITSENLKAYMNLARDLNVQFVRILEARAIGRYARIDVSLTGENQRILESLHDGHPGNRKALRKTPAISYPDLQKRRHGCIGGKKYLYVDTDGNAYPCPFCKRFPSRLDELNGSNLSERLVCPS